MTKRNILFVVMGGFVLSFLAVVCLSHRDIYYISYWAIELLEHIQDGNLINFAVDLVNENHGTNYNLFQNINVALWILPIYLFEKLVQIAVPIVVYQTWIKAIIASLHVLCVKELYQIILKLGFDKRKAIITCGLYFCSPIVLIHGIGIGQIDCIGVLFYLLSIRLYLEKRYYPMAITMGFALLSKFFVVMFYVPLFLIHFDKIKKTFQYACITISIPIIEKVITNLLIKDFQVQAQYHNQNVFYPRLFMSTFNGESLFILGVLILCGIYLILGSRGIRKTYYWILCPMLIFILFFVLVFWHPQWLIYALPLIYIMGCYISSELEYAFYYFGMIMGYTLWSIGTFNTTYYNSILISESLLGELISGKQQYISLWIKDNVFYYTANIGLTIFLASIILITVLFYLNVKKCSNDENYVINNIIWICIMLIPILIYYLLLFVSYFWGLS